MKKKIIIAISAALSAFILTWIILFFLFPMSIIDGERYNSNKLNKLSKQRKTDYNELYISLDNEINNLINNLYINPAYIINTNIRDALEIFYAKSTDIDKNYNQLTAKSKIKISFPLQNKKLRELTEVFPSYINAIEYNGEFYNEFALNLFMGQYESIIKKIIEAKTNDFIEYINYYSFYSETDILAISDFTDNKYYYETSDENILDYYLNQCIIKTTDEINFSVVNISDSSFLNIPVTAIDNVYYDSTAVNELQKSMKIISPELIKNTKNILIKGINYQTEIYTKNIDSYVDWFYSYFTSLDKGLTKIIGFFTGKKSVEEKYYMENFNRIMNKNTDFESIIGEDIYKQVAVITNIYDEYFNLKNYFSLNFSQNTINNISDDDFIEPFIGDIMLYYEHVFKALDSADNYYLQEYTIKDDNEIKNIRTAVKLLSDVSFIGGILIDYLSLKTQELFSKQELKQQIFNSMMENQNNKAVIVNNPFTYLLDKLSVGNILFVDNYFAGFNTYQHYGVYIGNGKVIHFAPLEGQEISMENGIIHESTLESFLNGRALQIDKNVEKRFSEDEIVKRARSRLGEKGYSLITNNCEHFARWCVTGENISYQVINSPQKLEGAISAFNENFNMFTKFLELFN